MRIDHDRGVSALLKSTNETKICDGFGFTEGPIWIPGDECLLFTDIPASRIYRWRPGMANAEIYREPTGNANGLTLDRDGNVIACEHSGRRVSSGAYGSEAATIVDRFEGKRFNSPNDVVVHSSGAIYFTDPPYGLEPNDGKELDFQGVYRVDPDGTITCLTKEFTGPNGLAFSPDEAVLYIDDSEDKFIKRFKVEPDGSLSGGELFVDQRGDTRPGDPDGMKVDTDGRLWTTGVGGISVVDPDGTVLGQIVLPEIPANLAFGGSDFSTIFATARTSVYQIETLVRGVAPGSR